MAAESLQQALAAARQHLVAGRLREAEVLYRQVLQQQPENHEALHHLGLIAFQCNAHADALGLIDRSLALAPGVAYYHRNRGEVLRRMGRMAEAEAAVRSAMRVQADFAYDHHVLGLICEKTGRMEEAIGCYERAVQLNPALADSLYNLGALIERQGRYQEAMGLFDRAIAARPNYALARVARATALLRLGQWQRGWEEYEWRFGLGEFAGRRPIASIPVWDGAAWPGRTILVRFEQGMGDTLQFVRYVPLVAQRGLRVVLEVQPPLRSLLARVPGVAQCIAEGWPLPPADVQAPLMSLPRIFGTTPQTIPAPGAYLNAQEQRVEVWKRRIAEDGKLKVGLVWAGNPKYPNDRRRSVALEAFAPLGAVEGVEFYSVQKGQAAEQARAAPAGLRLIDQTEHLGDFDDTAAMLTRLDLLITVDSAPGHLSGGLGRPTWTLVPFVPDWRWMLERADTPWYRSVRLYRQARADDWTPVIARIAEDLAALARDRQRLRT